MASATLTVTAIAPPGVKFTVLSSPNISDTPSVAFGQNPTPVTGDLVVFRKFCTKDGVTTSYSVTISTNGMITIYSQSDSASLSFLYWFWDESASAYGTTGTYSINPFSATPHTAKNIYQWLYAQGAEGGTLDRAFQYLATLGYGGQAINTLMFTWLGDLGYTGTLSNRIRQFEDANLQ